MWALNWLMLTQAQATSGCLWFFGPVESVAYEWWFRALGVTL